MGTKWKKFNDNGASTRLLAFLGVLLTNPLMTLFIADNTISTSFWRMLFWLFFCCICLALVVFLFVRTGRVPGSDDIDPGELGRLSPEALVVLILLTFLMGFWGASALWSSFDIILCGTICGGVILLFLLALARKWKARRLIADSILVRLWPRVRVVLRFLGRACLRIFTGENYLDIHHPAGQAWVYRILWVCSAMAGLVIVSYLILSNQLLGVGKPYWFGSGRYTAFALFSILVVVLGAGYLIWRAYRDAHAFDMLLAQLDEAAKGLPAPVCVPENSGLYTASKAVADLGVHLQESVAAQIKSERMKLDLITNVSHDLKTPLTSIIGYLDLLEKQENLPAETRDYVLILRRKSERLATTVADLFTLAKATSGNETLHLEPLDLVMAVRQTMGDMSDAITRTGIPIKASMPSCAWVQADSAKLYRVLQNITDNALRYSLRGTRIYLDIARGDIATRLTLTNTASYEMTFAPEDVLQRFVRGDASRTTEGSGLGLSIAQTFMQNFGGDLEVGVRGDAFTVTLTFPNLAQQDPAESGLCLEVFGAPAQQAAECWPDQAEEPEAAEPDDFSETDRAEEPDWGDAPNACDVEAADDAEESELDDAPEAEAADNAEKPEPDDAPKTGDAEAAESIENPEPDGTSETGGAEEAAQGDLAEADDASEAETEATAPGDALVAGNIEEPKLDDAPEAEDAEAADNAEKSEPDDASEANGAEATESIENTEADGAEEAAQGDLAEAGDASEAETDAAAPGDALVTGDAEELDLDDAPEAEDAEAADNAERSESGGTYEAGGTEVAESIENPEPGSAPETSDTRRFESNRGGKGRRSRKRR